MDSSILVVSNQTELREQWVNELAEQGFDAVGSTHRQFALKLAKNKLFDLMICDDSELGNLDGLRDLKSTQAKTPLVLLQRQETAYSKEQLKTAGIVECWPRQENAEKRIERVVKHVPHPSELGFVLQAQQSKAAFQLVKRVAKSDVSVLLSGESGTGKEVYSRYIHQFSPRRNEPFVAVNCAAIPETMLESILFGYEKGAFTGAYQSHSGKFEQAQGGTILLDEISEINLGLQAKLLRVIQEKEVERICGLQPIHLDVRVLATTNRDLKQDVASGRFREDLFYRLNVFPIQLSPLRERTEDIFPLASLFLAKHSDMFGTEFVLSNAAKEKLLAHNWPGNVRELENVMQRALVMANGNLIEPEAIQYEQSAKIDRISVNTCPDRLNANLWQSEQQMIMDALSQVNGSRKRAAEALGISARTLRYKLARMRDEGFEVPQHLAARYA